jgi:hypothetical protein
MSETPFPAAFPLTWPAGWPRTKTRKRARYRTDFSRAVKDLLRQLKLMDCPDWNVIISSNIPVKGNGLPYADNRRIHDPGVAVYFRRGESPQVIACDKWDLVADNIRAVGLTVEALRGIARAGASELLDRAFLGFKALPSRGETSPAGQWWQVLGVAEDASHDVVRAAYRELARKHHPDAGGDAGAMAMINRAWEEAQQ